MDNLNQPVKGFISTGLLPEIVSILRQAGLSLPTPIQEQAIPIALRGRDLIGVAQTGTGKTLAFALPVIQNLLRTNNKSLILVPTRELALQVEESFRKITGRLPGNLRTVCLIGGIPLFRQVKELRFNPRLIIATPGRLNDLLNQRAVDLSRVASLVLDEADRMLDMGFLPQINRIFEYLPAERQTLLFSATMAPAVITIANRNMHSPLKVEVSNPETPTASQIRQELCYVSSTGKTNLLQQLLTAHSGSALVFSRTKHGAAKLSRRLQADGHSSVEIHSNRSLSQRRQALDGFKSGKYRVLVATDVAARGIDVKDIALVVNFDLPDAAEDYVHRIGRTGRAGKSGKAVSFATPDQQRNVKNIERFVNFSIPLSPLSEKPSQPRPVNPARPTFRHRFNSTSSTSRSRYVHRSR